MTREAHEEKEDAMNQSYLRSDARPVTNDALRADAPVGFYVVVNDDGQPIESVQATLYDAKTDAFIHDVHCELLARVDPGGELPKGMELAMYRPDGKRLIQGWVPITQ